MRKPTPLHIGSRIALLAPSSSVSGKKLDAALASTRFLGFDPVVFPTAAGQHGYFSGTDQERADDLNQAFSDSSIEGIFCIRGGYGAGRILPLLDYDTIQKNPKVFLGYSDITALHTVFNQICDFATLHAPMPGGNYINADKDTVNLLRSHLQPLSHREKVSKAPWEMLFPGNAEGPVCGGNLSVLVSCLGSPYEIDTRGKILFLEEVAEETYKIDRNLTALALAGKFNDCAGIFLGYFLSRSPDDLETEHGLTLSRVFEETILPFQKPVFTHFPAGHQYPNYSIPMGLPIRLNGESKSIDFLDSLTELP